MAITFLDTNKVIDLVIRHPEISKLFVNHSVFYSPLSTHILFYTFHIKVPSLETNNLLKTIQPVSLTDQIINKAVFGPTNDLEDNIQLHSAVASNCDFFLTSDKKLLKMAYFGKVKITNHL